MIYKKTPIKIEDFILKSEDKGFTKEALMVIYDKVNNERDVDIEKFNYNEWYEKKGDYWISNDCLYVLSNTTLFRRC